MDNESVNQNRLIAENIIRKRENPNPVFIITIIIIIIMIVNIIFRTMVSYSLTGRWIDQNNHENNILHNTCTNELIINDSIGEVSGNFIKTRIGNELKVGMIYKGLIYWNNGDIWKKELKFTV